MSSLLSPPAAAPAAMPSAPRHITLSRDADRTLRGLLGACLGAVPLQQLFSDGAWLVPTWFAMALVLVPAALLRMKRPSSPVHLLPGIGLVVCWLTATHLPENAWAGLVPSAATFGDLQAVAEHVSDVAENKIAPVATDSMLILAIAGGMVVFAIVIDLLVACARRGGLAGVPLLLVFTLAGAVPKSSVDWIYFVPAALGFLVLLSADARDQLATWGTVVERSDRSASVRYLARSGRRIALIAVVAAVLLPSVLPVGTTNSLANLFNGGGGGGGIGVAPLASLRGQLELTDPIPLLEVTIDPTSGVTPHYLRQSVLDSYDGTAWRAGDAGSSVPLRELPAGVELGTFPPSDGGSSEFFDATVRVLRLAGPPPVFSRALGVEAPGEDMRWSPRDLILVGGRVTRGELYFLSTSQPAPTVESLQASPPVNPVDYARWLAVPQDTPPYVTSEVNNAIKGASTPYERAKAVSDYFTRPGSRFSYTLKTDLGDSGSDLEDFLRSGKGFCQQFAAATAVMMRLAGIPSRVVIGYTHETPDQTGRFEVTSRDAHAWVESYFEGIGWVSFDTTPLGGQNRGATFPWAQPTTATAAPTATATATATAPTARTDRPDVPEGPTAGDTTGQSDDRRVLPWLFGALAVLALVAAAAPAVIRLVRRRRRLAAARAGLPDPLWAELRDTAEDLGYVWSPSRSPRQVLNWLDREGLPGECRPPLRSLVSAVEQSAYARDPGTADGRRLITELRTVEAGLREQRTGVQRLRARVLPGSLGIELRLPKRRKH